MTRNLQRVAPLSLREPEGSCAWVVPNLLHAETAG